MASPVQQRHLRADPHPWAQVIEAYRAHRKKGSWEEEVGGATMSSLAALVKRSMSSAAEGGAGGEGAAPVPRPVDRPGKKARVGAGHTLG